MSEAVRTTARPGSPDLLDDFEGNGVSVNPTDLFERLWHLFISMRTGLALILALALLSLVGTLLAQAPAGLLGDKEAYALWLDGVRPKYGGWTTIFDFLGFFSVFNSVLFKSLVVLLSTSILACSINRAPRLWKQAVHPRTVMSPGFYQHAALRSSVAVPGDTARAEAALEAELRHRGFRTVVHSGEAGMDIYADKYRWGPFGTVFAHLSIILMVIGAMLGASGFRDDRFAVTVGSKVDVGNGTALTVEATSFMDSYYQSGAPADYASNLVLYENGQQVAEKTIRVNDPMRYGDISIYQSFFGAAADLQVKDASGTVIYEQGVPLQYSDGDNSIGQLKLDKQGLTVLLVAPASGRVDPAIKAGTMQLEVYKGVANTTVGTQIVSPGKPVTIGDYTYTFVRERQYTGLIVARDPGIMFVWGGALLMVFGVMLVFFFPNRRIWARVRPAESGSVIEAGAITRHDVMFESAFGSLMDNVKLAAAGPGKA